MEGLTDRQAKFLSDYAFDERTMSALMKDHQVSPGELREWRQQTAFVEELEAVNAFLSFQRMCDMRKGACDYARRTRLGVNGEIRQMGARQAAEGRHLLREARLEDRSFLPRGMARPGVIIVNPIHPAFMNEAPKLLARLEALQRRVMEMKKEQKALPAPEGGKA